MTSSLRKTRSRYIDSNRGHLHISFFIIVVYFFNVNTFLTKSTHTDWGDINRDIFLIIAVTLLSSSIILAFAACSSDKPASEEPAPEETADTDTSDASDASDASDPYTFNGVGFSYELPEGVTIEKGSLDKLDNGEVSYGSGVRMGFPVYFDMTDEEMSAQPDQVQQAPTFVVLCVANAETTEQAKEKILDAMSHRQNKSTKIY